LAKLKDVKPEQAPAIALVKSKSLWALGRIDEALRALSDPALADQPQVQVLRAEILADAGREAEALELLKKHLDANPSSLSGHYVLGAVSEKVGDLDAARKAFAWFVEEPHQFLERWKQKP